MQLLTIFGISGAPVPQGVRSMHLLGPRTSNPFGLEGTGYIAGDTAIDGDPANPSTPDTPVQAMVRLYRDRDGRLVAQRMSDPVTGAWRFDNVNEVHTYTAVAYFANYRAVLADGVKPEPMA